MRISEACFRANLAEQRRIGICYVSPRSASVIVKGLALNLPPVCCLASGLVELGRGNVNVFRSNRRIRSHRLGADSEHTMASLLYIYFFAACN